MKWLAFALTLLSTSLFAQEGKIGHLIDKSSGEAVIGAHVQNLTDNLFTTSNGEGSFKMPMDLGDSIWITCVGYQPKGVVIGAEWAELPEVSIELVLDTVVLDAVTIRSMPTESEFKSQLLAHKLKENPDFYGIEQIDVGHSSLLEDRVVKSVGFALQHPVGFLYHNLSKKEKEKRKMHRIRQDSHKSGLRDQKYNREYVAELTGLKGDQLTDFIAYCDFDDDFLDSRTQYELSEVIVAKLDDFLSGLGKG